MIWLAIFSGIVLLMLLREHLGTQGEVLSQYQFEQLVDADQIGHATINYDPQNQALNEVVGRYYRTENGARVEVPFRTTVRLTGRMEERLLRLPQFEPRQPNTALMSIVFSILPIVIIAALIWFFFIRQIKKAVGGGLKVAELHAKTAEQQSRFDRILDKWEAQAGRMDAVLDKMERDAGVKP